MSNNSVIFCYEEDNKNFQKIFLDTNITTSLLEFAIDATKWAYEMGLTGRLEIRQSGKIILNTFIEFIDDFEVEIKILKRKNEGTSKNTN